MNERTNVAWKPKCRVWMAQAQEHEPSSPSCPRRCRNRRRRNHHEWCLMCLSVQLSWPTAQWHPLSMCVQQQVPDQPTVSLSQALGVAVLQILKACSSLHLSARVLHLFANTMTRGARIDGKFVTPRSKHACRYTIRSASVKSTYMILSMMRTRSTFAAEL